MTAAWRYELSGAAVRDLPRLDPQVRQRVLAALDRYVAGASAPDVRRVVGADEWRMRVGDWRVRYVRDEESKTLVGRRVVHRGVAYR